MFFWSKWAFLLTSKLIYQKLHFISICTILTENLKGQVRLLYFVHIFSGQVKKGWRGQRDCASARSGTSSVAECTPALAIPEPRREWTKPSVLVFAHRLAFSPFGAVHVCFSLIYMHVWNICIYRLSFVARETVCVNRIVIHISILASYQKKTSCSIRLQRS